MAGPLPSRDYAVKDTGRTAIQVCNTLEVETIGLAMVRMCFPNQNVSNILPCNFGRRSLDPRPGRPENKIQA